MIRLALKYAELGLKVGLEIHQQLSTSKKLFCECPAKLSTLEPRVFFTRRLRPTQSELGEIDPAAMFEFKRGKTIVYETDEETSCLVEADEEPPHDLNREALNTCLMVALMMGAKPVDEIHVMRKIVIDGSTPFGFQRTAIVALNGEIDVDGERVGIKTITVEEDAARKVREEGNVVHYRLDRLGIPLIEIATEPMEKSPRFVGKAALRIGRILRATKRVKRGLGTIRQDLNVSITGGGFVEIKGVQELEMLPKVVEYEVKRQLALLDVRDELKKRVGKRDIKEEFVDVTDVFNTTRCKVLKTAIDGGGKVLAVRLKGFGGLLKRELLPGLRLGTELADRAVFWGRVGGIFHTDELPGSGITMEETLNLKQRMKCGEEDAVVIVAGPHQNTVDALKAVVERAKEALDGVPSETRGPQPSGITRYERPRPGAARMYPETDVPSVVVTDELLRNLRERLPRLPEEEIQRLMREFGLNEKLANQILDSDFLPLFESVAKSTGVPPSVIAVTLTETMKSLRRDGFKVDLLTDEQIEDVFKLIDSGLTAKEAIPDILSWLCEHEGAKPEKALDALGLRAISKGELEALIEETLRKNLEMVRKMGKEAQGRLMGKIMSQVRGRASVALVSQILRDKLSAILKGG